MDSSLDFQNCSEPAGPPVMLNVVYMDNPEEMLKPWKSNPMFIEIAVIHAITFIFGLLGNVLVIVSMAGDRRARSATNTFLVSLAVGDLLMLCVNGPLETCYHFVIQWDENSVVCKAAKLAELLSATSSVLNLLAVTVERFIVIVFPMKSRTLCTEANMARAVFAVWLLAIALALPIIFTTGTYQYNFTNNVTTITLNYCDYSLKYPNVVIYQFVVVFVLPSCLLTICYAFVIKELWASTRQMTMLTHGGSFRSGQRKKNCRRGKSIYGECSVSESEQEGQNVYPTKTKKQSSVRTLRSLLSSKGSCGSEVVTLRPSNRKDAVNYARKQVIKMLILVVILFFVCWGPRLTMEVLQKFGLVPFNNLIYRLRMTFNVMTFFHGCINPFIYCFMSKNFRVRFLAYLKFCGLRQRPDVRSDVILVPIPSPKNLNKNSKSPESVTAPQNKNVRKNSATETKNTEIQESMCANTSQCGCIQKNMDSSS